MVKCWEGKRRRAKKGKGGEKRRKGGRAYMGEREGRRREIVR